MVVCAIDDEIRKDPTVEPPHIVSNQQHMIRVPWKPSYAERTSNRISYRFFPAYWRRKNLVPDKYIGWKTRSLETVSKYLEQSEFIPDVVVTFAQPFTDHLVGLELKKRYGFKWIAHFSDPWVDNPFNSYDGRTKNLNLRLEESVVNFADMTILTSDETVDLVFRKYSQSQRQKARVLPHCYDRNLFLSGDRKLNKQFLIRYVGNFYGNRTPRPLITALERLTEREPETLADFSFELIGDTVASLQSEISAIGLPEGLVSLQGHVNYRESLALMAESDGLLVIDAPSEKSVFLPSKLIDYVGAGRPLFGITPDGAASDLIKRLGGYVAKPDDTDSIVSSLKDFLEFLRNRKSSKDTVWGTEEIRARYEARVVAERFMELLREVKGLPQLTI